MVGSLICGLAQLGWIRSFSLSLYMGLGSVNIEVLLLTFY